MLFFIHFVNLMNYIINTKLCTELLTNTVDNIRYIIEYIKSNDFFAVMNATIAISLILFTIYWSKICL